jgi:hypothetical protein
MSRCLPRTLCKYRNVDQDSANSSLFLQFFFARNSTFRCKARKRSANLIKQEIFSKQKYIMNLKCYDKKKNFLRGDGEGPRNGYGAVSCSTTHFWMLWTWRWSAVVIDARKSSQVLLYSFPAHKRTLSLRPLKMSSELCAKCKHSETLDGCLEHGSTQGTRWLKCSWMALLSNDMKSLRMSQHKLGALNTWVQCMRDFSD